MRRDALLLMVMPLLAVAVSLLLKANFFVSTLLFFGLPALYLSWRRPKIIAKAALFSFLLNIPLFVVADYIATINQAWLVPTTIFPFRILGILPIEDFIWGMLLVYLIVIFYEHFLDRGRNRFVKAQMKYFVYFSLVFAFTIITLGLLNTKLIAIPYIYFILGISFFILPTAFVLMKYPKLLPKFSIVASYFFYLAATFEITGLYLNQWSFPGDQYLGWVEILNQRMPIEEFFFWFVLAGVAVLSYYEFLDDDRK